MSFSIEKQAVSSFFTALERAQESEIQSVFDEYCASEYKCFASYPWRLIESSEAMVNDVWMPMKSALHRMQRREDIFFAGNNEADGNVWVVSMGHFMGLFDEPFLDIPPTGKIAMLRYAEFNCVVDGKIASGGLFVDLIGLMRQAGFDPLPNETGQHFIYPGPRTHDGLLYEDADQVESQRTSTVLNQMIDDLDELNLSGDDRCPPEFLARTWVDDMVWYGPAGIGASFTIPRYQQQHQYPFREGLTNKVFNGHICRVAEGNYAGFFGWPNLKNTAAGGFLGLPKNDVHAEMQVVDIYRREGDKLAENWVIIDLPYWLKQQGMDIFERMGQSQSGLTR